MIVLGLTLCLIVSLVAVTPASANQFWQGVAVGVGSAIVLSHIVTPPRPHYYEYRPVRVYGPPPPPVYRERWVPVPHHSHWRHPGPAYVHPYAHGDRYYH